MSVCRYTRGLYVRCSTARRLSLTPKARYSKSTVSRAAGAGESGGWRGEETVVLGVETSCDDTGVAVIRGSGELMGSAVASQTDVHKT